VSEEPIIACSLTGSEQADRTEQWRRLLTTAIRSAPVSGGIRFVLPVEMSAQIATLAVAEQRCCPFFEFTLRLADGCLAFEVHAPTQATSLVADLFGT
jgi:hypothetical protein